MEETWKQIPSFPLYEASSLGRLRRASPAPGTRVGLILKPKIHPQGYHLYRLALTTGVYQWIGAHRVVCETYHGSAPEGKPFALHRDDKPSNNKESNLYWGSREQNAKDALTNGRYLRGEACGSSKHDEQTIRAIIAEREREGTSLRLLAERYGISKAQVGKILNGQSWRHLR